MIISITSRGSLVVRDVGVIEVSRGASSERIFRIPARLRYQTILASNSTTVTVIVIKWDDKKCWWGYLIMRMLGSSLAASCRRLRGKFLLQEVEFR